MPDRIGCVPCTLTRRDAVSGSFRDYQRGFTVIELIVGISIIAIMTTLALPAINAWRAGMNYRNSAKSMVSMLREARSMSIANNLQYMVVFKPNSSCYQILQGNQTYNTSSTGYTTVVRKIVAPPNILVRSGSSGSSTANIYVQFNPNGTATIRAPDLSASDSNASVNDTTGQKYRISTTPTGRINLTKTY